MLPVLIEQKQGQETAGVDQTPDNEIPAGTVPKTTHQENNKRIADGLGLSVFGAPERNIEVISEPRRERDVPAAPKLGEVSGEVWEFEVTQQFKAKEFGGTERNIGIAREVSVDLKAKTDGA